MKLCLALGYASPRLLLQDITSSEVVEWEALYAIDPWGDERADLRSAIIAYTVASAHVKKGRKLKIDQFMPDYDAAYQKATEGVVRQSNEQFAKNLLDWHRLAGGTGEVPEELKQMAGKKK